MFATLAALPLLVIGIFMSLVCIKATLNSQNGLVPGAAFIPFMFIAASAVTKYILS